jgi:hypothetical protein
MGLEVSAMSNVVDALIYKLLVHCDPSHPLKDVSVVAWSLVFMCSGHLTPD